MNDFTYAPFVTLGEIDLSEPQFDRAATVLVLWEPTEKALYTLQAWGCTCCGDLWDDVAAADAEKVDGGLMGLAETLVKQLNETSLETEEDQELAEEEIRQALRNAAKLLTPAAPLALN